MIWRDDDVGAAQVNYAGQSISGTKMADLRAVSDMFILYGIPHTIAVMAKDLDTRPDLVEFILERGMNVQLHCWTHDDLTADPIARDDLERGRDLLADLFGRPPSVLYPPWNRSSADVEEVAANLGMRVSHQKASLSQFIRVRGNLTERTVNFHHWAKEDRDLLKVALAIEASLR